MATIFSALTLPPFFQNYGTSLKRERPECTKKIRCGGSTSLHKFFAPILPPSSCSRRAYGIIDTGSFEGTRKLACEAMKTSQTVGRGEESKGRASSGLAQLTHLESNSWLWEVKGVTILVDPILVGNLDFGIPWLYDGAKKLLGQKFQIEDLPELDLLLITQSLDDHCHMNTLTPLSQKLPELHVIATPNAEPKLKKLFKNVTYLEPGESTSVKGRNGQGLSVKATKGPVLGPPWQRPENGYILRAGDSSVSLYHEPHCVFAQELEKEQQVDIVVTPVVQQLLPGYKLVSGQEDAARLAKLLQAKYVVPMANGELDAKGLLSMIVSTKGSNSDFEKILKKELPDAQFLPCKAGEPLTIPPA
eukprot:jgi/Mesen1/7329/ME000376S06486